MAKKKIKLSVISALHCYKLVFRSLLFLAALIAYCISRARGDLRLFGEMQSRPLILAVIWVVFVLEMVLRFFPSKLESMGCQKQFRHNYIPMECGAAPRQTWRSTLAIALAWILLNAVIGGIYFLGWIDEGILILISLAYSICDMICILFFCPFQTWFMKNKCCGTCRIYNWDYAMMFTPLVFIPDVFTWSILGIALLLLAVWEISVRLHPERFCETTNAGLSCANCREKLCHHKTQLRHFLKKNKDTLLLKGNTVISKAKKKFK
ncbi:MAG: hypothetical protein IIU58_04815 [Clostridia bacterium]|nr:hypothetical protein [Clostridia bacterium]